MSLLAEVRGNAGLSAFSTQDSMDFVLGLALGAAATAALLLPTAWRWKRSSIASSKQAEQRARDSEKLAEIGRLTGGLAHEIRNPLSTLKVNLQLLLEDLKRPSANAEPRVVSRIETLKQETDRLADILDDFLRYAGKYELNLQDTNLNDLLSELIDFYRPQAGEKNIQMRVSLADEPLMCRLDAGLIKQAILNLLINATQAMPAGGELIIRAAREGRSARLDIADTGSGIDPADIEKIFEAYYSTRPGGTGLGLPTTRRIILEHQGNISVFSEPGKGTNFTIKLPLAGNDHADGS